jgi:hypothetical protein
VGAGFHQHAILDDEDAIGAPNGSQAMGDHKGAAILHQSVEGELHQALALRIARSV